MNPSARLKNIRSQNDCLYYRPEYSGNYAKDMQLSQENH